MPKSPENAATSIEAKVVSNAEELMQVFAIRSAVYMAEQRCPYEEEFDGNDYTATHILGLVDGKPAACLRMRWFAGFAKAERMTALRAYRGSGVIDAVAGKCFDLAERKGYRRLHIHAQRRLVPRWAGYGFRPKSNCVFHFSDHEYVTLVRELEPPVDALDEDTDPMVLLRPEGDFDRPGVLERSQMRAPTNPVGL